MKPFEQLTLKDSFMFFAVTRDPDECGRMLACILGWEILDVRVFREETLSEHPLYRGVRLDVLAIEEGTKRRFNIEMQQTRREDLAKRSRYYHSVLDRDALKAAEAYDKLPDTIVIFICDFDPFGEGSYRYHFRMMSETGLLLRDGRDTFFLSTQGKDDKRISDELRRFLKIHRRKSPA